MSFIADYALDALVTKLIEGTRLDLCSVEPATYTAATTTNTLANKTGMTAGAVSDRTPNGRKTTIPAIVSGSPGTVTGTGTIAYWAWSDPANSRLLATGPLSSSQSVSSGNTFTQAAFDIGIADATT